MLVISAAIPFLSIVKTSRRISKRIPILRQNVCKIVADAFVLLFPVIRDTSFCVCTGLHMIFTIYQKSFNKTHKYRWICWRCGGGGRQQTGRNGAGEIRYRMKCYHHLLLWLCISSVSFSLALIRKPQHFARLNIFLDGMNVAWGLKRYNNVLT